MPAWSSTARSMITVSDRSSGHVHTPGARANFCHQTGIRQASPSTSGEAAGTITLPASFFTDNGFSDYVLSAVYGGITVTAGTSLVLQQENYIPTAALYVTASGASIRDSATIGLLPEGQRDPVSLTLEFDFLWLYGDRPGDDRGVTIDAGASIVAEANASQQATIDLSATVAVSSLVPYQNGGAVTVLGDITAPGGTIDIRRRHSDRQPGHARCLRHLCAGRDPKTAYQTGSVIDAGTISLTGDTSSTGAGLIIVEAGAEFLLDGAEASIQMPTADSPGEARYLTKRSGATAARSMCRASSISPARSPLMAARRRPRAARSSPQVHWSSSRPALSPPICRRR